MYIHDWTAAPEDLFGRHTSETAPEISLSPYTRLKCNIWLFHVLSSDWRTTSDYFMSFHRLKDNIWLFHVLSSDWSTTSDFFMSFHLTEVQHLTISYPFTRLKYNIWLFLVLSSDWSSTSVCFMSFHLTEGQHLSVSCPFIWLKDNIWLFHVLSPDWTAVPEDHECWQVSGTLVGYLGLCWTMLSVRLLLPLLFCPLSFLGETSAVQSSTSIAVSSRVASSPSHFTMCLQKRFSPPEVDFFYFFGRNVGPAAAVMVIGGGEDRGDGGFLSLMKSFWVIFLSIAYW